MYILWNEHCNYQNTPDAYAVKPSIYKSIRLYSPLPSRFTKHVHEMSINYRPIFFYTTLISIAHSNRWNCLYYSFELNEHLYNPNKTKNIYMLGWWKYVGFHVHDNEYLKANSYVFKNGSELIKGRDRKSVV